jgi:TonB-dependent SusC/RagA subfamily outer membrane receptor
MRKKTWAPAQLSKLFFLFSLLLFSVAAFAQTVTGTITDADGKPISNVSVQVKGTNRTALTDAAGKFSISASGNDVLVVSYVGYNTQEVRVNDRQSISVSMAIDTRNMENVVVTALGIRKEARKLGYAATQVDAEELVKSRTTNVGENLEGRVAGLNITPPAAGAGSSNQIRLRGQVGFAGSSNSPLIVINGLPMDQGARNAEGAGQQRDRGDNLNIINPDDIETMTVLKGATAAALYGSRAAAGAIIITTKSGQKNQGIGVDFNSSYTVQQPVNYMDEIRQYDYGQGLGGVKFTTAGQAV